MMRRWVLRYQDGWVRRRRKVGRRVQVRNSDWLCAVQRGRVVPLSRDPEDKRSGVVSFDGYCVRWSVEGNGW